jgi:hypothetical protein
VNLYVNRENLGFEDCDDVEATQTLTLTTEDLRESAPATQLKFVKYQRVKTLTIYIEDNQGGEVTALGGIKFFGRVRQRLSPCNHQKYIPQQASPLTPLYMLSICSLSTM